MYKFVTNDYVLRATIQDSIFYEIYGALVVNMEGGFNLRVQQFLYQNFQVLIAALDSILQLQCILLHNLTGQLLVVSWSIIVLDRHSSVSPAKSESQ